MKNFKEYLDNLDYPSKKDSWNIAGIIKGQNGYYKFDTRPLQKDLISKLEWNIILPKK
jgi:hypothetical protein